MKKKTVSLLLAIVMIFSVSTVPASALELDGITNGATNVFARVLGFVLEGIVGAINSNMRLTESFVPESDYTYDNFYQGTEEFISQAEDGAVWSLGKSEVSLVPDNWQDYNLYLGGFMSEQNLFTNDVREILDDMRVRVIALNDGSGRGTAVFATVDAIGVSNSDIRQIREMLSDFALENSINSINIFATHAHSCIDTQGLWTDISGKWPANLLHAFTGLGTTNPGTDPEYMVFFRDKIKTAIEQAVASMQDGTMTYAEKDIGEKYFNNKNRPSASSLDTKLKRFAFYPFDQEVKPTYILNMTAHPDVVGLAVKDDETKGHGLSGDYIYYIGQTLNQLGYDFMFFNGAICGIYIGRIDVQTEKRVDIAAAYGKEIARMAVGMTMTEEEIEADEELMALNFTDLETEGHAYVPWYEGWTPVSEQEVEPILNIALRTVELEATNPVIMAAAKLGVVNYKVKVTADEKYYITTEIGYMEMGEDIKIAFVPGEFCSDLVYGGASLTAQGSVSGEAFAGRPLVDIFGEDVIVFGLANDAIGYIVPDNDYCMCLAFGHYQESISIGRSTASTIITAFEALKQECA